MKNPHDPELIFVGEPFDGRSCKLQLEKTTVGRSGQNHLCIQDASVSAMHCEILANGSEIIVRDLKSSNGTFVSAVRIEGQAQLKHGQIVRFGNVNARLKLAGAGSDDSASDISAIHLHAKFINEARQECEQPKQAPQPVKLETGPNDPLAEHTVAMPHKSSVLPVPSQAEAAGGNPRPPGPNRTRWLLPLLLIALAVAMWLLTRK